jgi:hypothetical protein
MWRNDISEPDVCEGITYKYRIWSGYVIPPHAAGPDMSFLHIHLVRICHSSTYIWSRYVIPPHTHIWSGYVISGPDACGGMTYPDQMDMEK